MGRTVSSAAGQFKPGDRVKVKVEDRPGHIRTPWYIRGKTGWIERVHGDFLNPESLAFGRDGLPKKTLYLVAFDQSDVWGKSAVRTDKVLVDIYEHWLEPVASGGIKNE
ncbi:MAG TPA: SH3-like domain-containing protein [Candidatus Binatia bacterium]